VPEGEVLRVVEEEEEDLREAEGEVDSIEDEKEVDLIEVVDEESSAAAVVAVIVVVEAYVVVGEGSVLLSLSSGIGAYRHPTHR
jgi:hypothetical protein